ncbi:MAG: segregation/condensation protein A [Oscillospiraceae bacterium]|nr:segregation/condensation protein A [Oscillospiraceae bacterium]
MEQLKFKLEIKAEIFDGPLDLMLSLIAKHKLDIQDIEISVLLEQFLNYIADSKENEIELAGEFLEMAARLIYIKTVSLLPKHEAEELKKELEGALIEYALCKAMAEKLRKLFVGDVVFVREPLEAEIDMTYNLVHSVDELILSIGAVGVREKLNAPVEFITPIGEIKIDYVSVFSKVVYVLKQIKKGGRLKLLQLFNDLGRSEQVATFMALLELSSHGRISFSDDLNYIEFSKGGHNAVTEN